MSSKHLPSTPPLSTPLTLTCHLQSDFSAAPKGGQAGVVDAAGIAGPVLSGGDRGRLQVPREADGAVRVVVQGREPPVPLGLPNAAVWAPEFPLHLQALRGVEVGHKAEQFWGCLPRGSPYQRCWRQGHFGGLWDESGKRAGSESTLPPSEPCLLSGSPKAKG